MYHEDTKIGQNTKSGYILDTLAQVPPVASDKGFKDKKGTLKDLKKRARSKWYTDAVVSKLKYLPNTILKKYYSHAWNCCCKLYQNGQKLSARWCNTRICHQCNRLRTAKLMNGYIDQLGNLTDLDFVTLTRKNCTKEELKDVVLDMLKKASLIQRYIREKLKIEINGIRKLEITYNSVTKTFHPHLHYLVDKGAGHILVDEWLKRNIGVTQKQGWDKNKKCFVDIQDVRKADQKSLNEIFKYSTKIMSHKTGQIIFHLEAIDTIMEAMYKRRSIQTFGKIKKVDEEIDGEELNAQKYEELEDTNGGIIEWIWIKNDWISGETGNKLTGYDPSKIELEFIDEPLLPDIEKFIEDYPVKKTYSERKFIENRISDNWKKRLKEISKEKTDKAWKNYVKIAEKNLLV
jgi:hypothetical protein